VFLHLGIATAARKEAIFELQWETNILWDREAIFLGFKRGGKKRSTVPMTPTLRAVLTHAKKLARTPYVVEFEDAPVKSVRTSLAKAAIRAGLYEVDEKGEKHPWVTPHVLRHTAGVWMAADGVPLEEISDFMGHSDIGVTKRVYAKYQPEHMTKARSALDVSDKQCTVVQMNQK
jgi:integrase